MITIFDKVHLDAKDKDGNKVNPEERTYGTTTNKEFFKNFNGDYQLLNKSKESNKIDETKKEDGK